MCDICDFCSSVIPVLKDGDGKHNLKRIKHCAAQLELRARLEV